MLVYVDDLLVMGTKAVHDGLVARIQEEWKTSKPELVNSEEWVRFCGFEIGRGTLGGTTLVPTRSTTSPKGYNQKVHTAAKGTC